MYYVFLPALPAHFKMENCMSGIQRFTALEIFTNPDDLELSIFGNKSGWGLMITRGPDHRFKILITQNPVFPNSAQAIQAISNILRSICTSMTQELNNSESFIAKVFNSGGLSIDDANVLSGEYRERICRDLASYHVARTYTYKQKQAV